MCRFKRAVIALLSAFALMFLSIVPSTADEAVEDEVVTSAAEVAVEVEPEPTPEVTPEPAPEPQALVEPEGPVAEPAPEVVLEPAVAIQEETPSVASDPESAPEPEPVVQAAPEAPVAESANVVNEALPAFEPVVGAEGSVFAEPRGYMEGWDIIPQEVFFVNTYPESEPVKLEMMDGQLGIGRGRIVYDAIVPRTEGQLIPVPEGTITCDGRQRFFSVEITPENSPEDGYGFEQPYKCSNSDDNATVTVAFDKGEGGEGHPPVAVIGSNEYRDTPVRLVVEVGDDSIELSPALSTGDFREEIPSGVYTPMCNGKDFEVRAIAYPEGHESVVVTTTARCGVPAPQEVTPVAPTQVGNEVTIPDVEGVEYQDAEGNTLPAGTIVIEKELRVIATPLDGYDFPEGITSDWTFQAEPTPPVDPIVAYPVDFLRGVPACSDFEIPNTEGVDYVVDGELDSNILTLTITATPREGYAFEGDQVRVWTHEYDQTLCEGPGPSLKPTTPEPVKPSGPGKPGSEGKGNGNEGIAPLSVNHPAQTPSTSLWDGRVAADKAAPTRQLPNTGANAVLFITVGAAVTGLGVCLLAARRKEN